MFLGIYFSEPNGLAWEKPDADDKQREGALAEVMLFQFVGVGVAYYKNGISDSNMTFHTIGKWRKSGLLDALSGRPVQLLRLRHPAEAEKGYSAGLG